MNDYRDPENNRRAFKRFLAFLDEDKSNINWLTSCLELCRLIDDFPAERSRPSLETIKVLLMTAGEHADTVLNNHPDDQDLAEMVGRVLYEINDRCRDAILQLTPTHGLAQ